MIAKLLRLLSRNRLSASSAVDIESVKRLIEAGHAAEARSDPDEAEQLYRRAITTLPSSADAHMNLGNVLSWKGHRVAAVESYERAVSIDPEHPSAHYNLGLALLDGTEFMRIEQHFRTAIRLRENFSEAWVGLALAQEGQGKLGLAAQSYREALRIRPDHAEVHRSLGLIFQQEGNLQAALESLQSAVRIRPDYADGHGSLGVIYKELGQIHAAIDCYRTSLSLRPDHAEVLGDLGNALQEQGELDPAIESYRRALALKPDHVGGHSNLLFALNYHPDKAAEEIFDAYRAYDARFGSPQRHAWRPHGNDPIADRRLRVGYVSPDFNHHPVRHFLEPLLARHDKTAVEIFAYSESTREDSVTARYRAYADRWLCTVGLSDEAFSDRIRSDQIDILVDLAGHTASNRLGTFAKKPAPVSLTWLGYGYTTGLSAIDYFLTDSAGAPHGSDHLFSEKPWRLKTPGYVFRPGESMGAVGELPARRRGYVTFGTLTRSVRINHRSIRVWSEILKQVDGARLVVDSKNYLDAGMRASLVEKFARNGIEEERLELGYHSPPWDVLRGIDIGLDCFPHNSGTTLFETVYMGVPFVSLAGRASVGRLGSSILQGIGHPEWIAHTESEYVEDAVSLARDIPRLAAIRSALRAEMQASPLMDEVGFARRVEDAFREMFEIWAGGRSTES